MLTINYLVGVLIGTFFTSIPLPFFIPDFVMAVLWLTAIANTTNDRESCPTQDDCYYLVIVVPFAALNWPLFAATLTLYVAFVVPNFRSRSYMGPVIITKSDLIWVQSSPGTLTYERRKNISCFHRWSKAWDWSSIS